MYLNSIDYHLGLEKRIELANFAIERPTFTVARQKKKSKEDCLKNFALQKWVP